MNEQQIEGMPDGWRLVRIGTPNKGDCFIDAQGDVKHCSGGYHALGYAIIEKIEQPKQYRPFANAAEFEPHRDRWIKRPDAQDRKFKVIMFDDCGVCCYECRYSYAHLFEYGTVFDDGSPFGVEMTE